MVIGVIVLVSVQAVADLFLPTLMSDIIDKGVMMGDTGVIWRTGGIMLLVAGCGVVCAVLASFLSSRSASGFGRLLRSELFKKVEGLSLEGFDKIGTSTLVTRTTNDVTQVQMVLMVIMRMMISAPIMATGGIIMAMSKDKPLTLVLVAAMPLLAAIITVIASKGIPLFKKMQVKIDRMNLILREYLTGIRVIRAFNRSSYAMERFDDANRDLTMNYIHVNRIMAFLMPSLMMVMNVTSLAILWFGIIRIDQGGMQMGSLIAFTQYAMQILFSMLTVSMMFIFLPRAQAAATRINEVFAIPGETGFEPPAMPASGSSGTPDTDAGGYLEFRNVSFGYPGAEEPVLIDISFKVSPGEVVAITGSTGSGKSTLVNLILRFYETGSGSILIDGTDIREMSLYELRKKIGFIPQKTLLFSGMISDNIRYGKENATDEEVSDAAEISQAKDFINDTENGLGHIIAQGGTNISGGQKQRLAIARAIVRKPDIYIFDDSFSALDFKTDAKLRAALKDVISEAAVLIVAQRVGTILNADRIIVLNNGRIDGIGTHRELLGSCPVYREIVASQLSEEEMA